MPDNCARVASPCPRKASAALHVQRLQLRQAQGELRIGGLIERGAPLRWRIAAQARRFDPAALLPQWPGQLDFALGSTGALAPGRVQATLLLDRLGGTLRGHALDGSADLGWQPGQLPRGRLQLRSGSNQLRYAGTAKQARLTLDLPQLQQLLPTVSGALQGDAQLQGAWPMLSVQARLQGRALAQGAALGADALHVQAQLAALGSAPHGTLQLQAQGLDLHGNMLTTLRTDLRGSVRAWHLQADAAAPRGKLQLQLQGGATGSGLRDWQGLLQGLQLDPRAAPHWQLGTPAAWRYRAGAFSLQDTCLQQAAARLCLGVNRAADGALALDYRIESVPLAAFTPMLTVPDGLRIEGVLDGSGQIQRDAAGHLRGHASLQSPAGSVLLPGYEDQPLGWHGLRLRAVVGAQSGHLQADAALLPAGSVHADAEIAGAAQTLSGRVQLQWPDLHALEPLLPQVAALHGTLGADLALGGTLRAPRLQGHAQLAQVRAEVPALGLKLDAGQLQLDAAADGALQVQGSVQSGGKPLTLSGQGDAQRFTLHIRGDDVLAADIPAARVRISPDLQFLRDAQGYALSGSVLIPKADVDLARLPGAGAAQPSPDVVIVNRPPRAPRPPLPLRADVLVRLGDAVKLRGFGLDGALAGQLRISEAPGQAPLGRGEIKVSGTYRAYGQDLTIQQGRLLFAGTPLANPGLDITAVRVLPDVTPGLRVSGTAQQPVLQVFSTPAMEQSEALSYLLTGKPLSALGSAQGSMLNSAAQALGSAGGDLLAKGVGARLGVEAGVSDNSELGGAALTVGKYLSPRLYVGYGVGLFTPGQIVTLRYKISRLFDFEAQTSALYNRFSLKYRVEK